MAKNNIIGLKSGLNIKQEKFCLDYIKNGGNAREAYLSAGYKSKTKQGAISGGIRLLKNPLIRARLNELQDKITDDSIADMKEVKQKLTAILRQVAEEEVLMTEGVERGITETKRYKKTADLRTAAKAAELLAKMAGAFSDGTQMNVGVQVVLNDDIKE